MDDPRIAMMHPDAENSSVKDVDGIEGNKLII